MHGVLLQHVTKEDFPSILYFEKGNVGKFNGISVECEETSIYVRLNSITHTNRSNKMTLTRNFSNKSHFDDRVIENGQIICQKIFLRVSIGSYNSAGN